MTGLLESVHYLMAVMLENALVFIRVAGPAASWVVHTKPEPPKIPAQGWNDVELGMVNVF